MATKYDPEQFYYTFCWTKIWKVSILLVCYPFSMISKKVCVQKLQFNVDGCVHRTKRNTLDNCWSNLWVWQLVFFDAFVFHGSAICFWTSDRDSSFLCSAPSYMNFEWGALSDVPTPPRSGHWTKWSGIFSSVIRLCPSLKRKLDWKSKLLFDENPSSR